MLHSTFGTLHRYTLFIGFLGALAVFLSPMLHES